MVGSERLELSRVAPLEPKSSASTNFATTPDFINFRLDMAYYIRLLKFGKHFLIKVLKSL